MIKEEYIKDPKELVEIAERISRELNVEWLAEGYLGIYKGIIKW